MPITQKNAQVKQKAFLLQETAEKKMSARLQQQLQTAQFLPLGHVVTLIHYKKGM